MEKKIIPSKNIKGINKGYYERKNLENFIFLIKYYKLLEITDSKTKYYTKTDRFYTILSNNKIYKVNYKSAFLKYFEKNKKKNKTIF